MKVFHAALLLTGVLILWFALSMTVQSYEGSVQAYEPSVQQEFYYRVSQEHTFDFKGVQFFSLKSAEGSATISVDGDVKLSEALKALEGQRVRLTLENATLVLKRVDR